MSPYSLKTESTTLPVVVLKNSVLFPTATLNFEITDEESAKSLRAASIKDPFVFLTTYDEADETDGEMPAAEYPYYRIGTVAKIKQMLRTPEGQPRVLVDRLTGVNYLWAASGYAGGLTVLVDAEGKPIVTPVPDEEEEE